MPTYSPKAAAITRQWHVIDAEDVVLGRLAVEAATLLRGKHKPTFAPHIDGGDFVIIVNAEKVALSGNKRTDKPVYRHSGYPGGLKQIAYGDLLEKDAAKAIEKSVRGMGRRTIATPIRTFPVGSPSSTTASSRISRSCAAS